MDAAAALVTEGNVTRFSVDELADRADVARRTIFNHFASIDDVVTTMCAERLEFVIDAFRQSAEQNAPGDGGRSAMFDDVAHALRSTDVPTVLSFVYRALGGFDMGDPRALQIFQATFSRTSDELSRVLVQRNPATDDLETELLVSSLIHGTGVIANRWIAATGATTDDDARALWDSLLERLLASVRAGYPSQH
ncbi:TetR/AcrR family transcriptional regulator [Microbacterium sp. CH12i]|uniref:TetR/AcrR family transcriptional regulator n=1 Tax=Microbacterium sp. CH12i TaxID=1479651 RepID=UPI00068E66FA|nr:TetR/AcrR family transcriptional regulator [Microbacterium sp. CH12i]